MDFLQQAFQTIGSCCSNENSSTIVTNFALPLLRMFLSMFLGEQRAEEIANLTLCLSMDAFYMIFAATRLVAVAAYLSVLTVAYCVEHLAWLFAGGIDNFFSTVIQPLPFLLWNALFTAVPVLVNAVPALLNVISFTIRTSGNTLHCLATTLAWEIRENETIQEYASAYTEKLGNFIPPIGKPFLLVLYIHFVIRCLGSYQELFDYLLYLSKKIVSPRTKAEQQQPADTVDRQGNKYSFLVSRASRLDHEGRASAEAKQKQFNTEECMFCYEPFGTVDDLKATSEGGTLRLLRCGHVFDECCWTEYTKSGNGFWGQCFICKERVG